MRRLLPNLRNKAFEDFVDFFPMRQHKQMPAAFDANVGIRQANRQQPVVRPVNVQRRFVEDYRTVFFRSAAVSPVEHHSG